MMIEIDDDLVAAIASFRGCRPEEVNSLNIARVLQMAVDYRHRAITGEREERSVYENYACRTFPVIARLYLEDKVRRQGATP